MLDQWDNCIAQKFKFYGLSILFKQRLDGF